jgi:1-acyl-sn-glycerol-3-phosphate acyltransferase
LEFFPFGFLAHFFLLLVVTCFFLFLGHPLEKAKLGKFPLLKESGFLEVENFFHEHVSFSWASIESVKFDILAMTPSKQGNMHLFAIIQETVSKVPLIGRIATGMQCLYVDRANRGGVSTKVIERQRSCFEGHSVPPLVIFPEATTTNGYFLIKFHTGVFRGGFPVVPVVIKYRYRRFSPTYETIRLPYYIFKLFTQLYNEAEYTLLPIYYPNEVEKKDPTLYANNVRKVMQKELNCSLSESSYQDKLEYHRLLRGQCKNL